MNRNDALRSLTSRALALLSILCLSCSGGGGGDFADNGGMSGTGISQGSITSFGSIFVNGVEWDLDAASVVIDGVTGDETDLRVGMVVRIEGELARSGLAGEAFSVVFDDSLEGPIANDPVETNPEGTRKRFRVFDTIVLVAAEETSFDDGASFEDLAKDQVVEVSGFVNEMGAVRATRVALRGTFSGGTEAELRGRVSNLFQDMTGGGVFSLGSVTVRYGSATRFDGLRAAELANDQHVEVEGLLRASGDELDARVIELEEEGLGDEDFDDVEVEGFVTNYVSDANFRVAGTPVDASMAAFDPPGLVLGNGVQVEIKGRLEGGGLIASEVEGEGDDDADEEERHVKIRAAVSAVSSNPNTLTLLGIAVSVDGDTRLKDERDELRNFRFTDIAVGDWLKVDAIESGPGTARARKIDREEADDDVSLEGPVTDLDRLARTLSILDQPIPVDGFTDYFDENGEARSAEEFFLDPGDVRLGDTVRVKDESAADPAILGEADEVEIEEIDD
jgi:hypothetical protein